MTWTVKGKKAETLPTTPDAQKKTATMIDQRNNVILVRQAHMHIHTIAVSSCTLASAKLF